jgi:chromosome partitioning protein
MIISIVNHKGGTGKTTTTINLGSALAGEGLRVLLVDFDAQGSLSYSLGIEDDSPKIENALFGEISVRDIIQEREGLHVLPASPSLADAELAIVTSENRVNHLKNLLEEINEYDVVLIDCPPALSLLTVNALATSDYVIIPMQMDVLALRGLDSMLETVKKAGVVNPLLKVMGVLPVMADPRKNIYLEIHKHIRDNYSVHLFTQVIHTSVKAAEAPSFGKSVLSYAPACPVANDYRALAKEVRQMCESSPEILSTHTTKTY